MKVFSIALVLTALAATASADAQIVGTRLPTPTTSTSRGTSVDGSWYVVGRDANGLTIYERRTTDRNGNVVIQRARRNTNGSMTIISTRTVANNDGRNRNCDYTRSTNSVGDIIFGRNSDVYCDDNGTRVDGGWYQVGRGRDNNSIYERRTRDSSGRLIIQRARRNPNGTFTIISTRYANDNDKQWRKAQKEQQKAIRKQEKAEEKQIKAYNKAEEKQMKGYNKGKNK